MKLTRLRLVLLAAPLAVTACMAGLPGDTGVVMAPLSPPPSTASSAMPAATPTASGSALPPGVFFRDDFDGDALDPTRWEVYEREGRVLVRDGKLEMLVGGASTTFPLVVPTADNIPKEGPFYLEARYELLTTGRLSGFNIDYVPPSGPEDPGVTEPFVRWSNYKTQLNFLVRSEARVQGAVAPAGSLELKVPHRFRLEFDGSSTYRVIYDDIELITLQSRRRPTKLWFGPYPNQPSKATVWTSWNLDYVETGVLVTPDPARPRATPAPEAEATPMPGTEATPAASASPEAGASPEASASPEG